MTDYLPPLVVREAICRGARDAARRRLDRARDELAAAQIHYEFCVRQLDDAVRDLDAIGVSGE